MTDRQDVLEVEQAIPVQEGGCSCSVSTLCRSQICRPPQHFSKRGLLFPIYFYSVILIGGLVFLQCLFSVGTILYNLQGSFCSAQTTFICKSSISNIIHNESPMGKQIQMQTWNNYLQILSMMLYYQFTIFVLKKKANSLSKKYISQGKYALMVKHIRGAHQDVYQNIIKAIEDQYEESVGSRNSVIKYYPIVPKRRKGPQEDNMLSIEALNSQVRIERAVKTKVILVFSYPVKITEFHNQHLQEMTDVTDMMWENIGVMKQQSRNVFMILGTFGVMALCFLIILLIKQWIKQEQVGVNSTKVFISNLGVATVAALFNTLEGIIIRKCCREERYSNFSKFFKVVGRRLSALFFMNMVISTFLANLFIIFMRRNKDDRYVPINYEGLVTDFFFLFITNTYLSSIFNLFDIVYGLKLIKRLKLRYFPQRCTYSDLEKVEIMAGHPVDMGLRYANIMKSLFFTSAIAPFVPIGSFFTLGGVMISYWVDKYLLIERYVTAHKLSDQFGKSMIYFSKYSVVLVALSNLILQVVKIDKGANTEVPSLSNSSDFYLSIGFLVLTLVYKFYWENIRRILFPNKPAMRTNQPYQEAAKEFEHKYSDKLEGISYRGSAQRQEEGGN